LQISDNGHACGVTSIFDQSLVQHYTTLKIRGPGWH